MALDKVDAVVVGAGAAGPIVAKELAVAGYHVDAGQVLPAVGPKGHDLYNQRPTSWAIRFGQRRRAAGGG